MGQSKPIKKFGQSAIFGGLLLMVPRLHLFSSECVKHLRNVWQWFRIFLFLHCQTRRKESHGNGNTVCSDVAVSGGDSGA